MKKVKNIFILIGIFSFSLYVYAASDIKEIKLLDDYSNEIIFGKNQNSKDIKVESIENISTQKKSSSTPKNNYIRVNANDVIDIYKKKVEDGIVYKKGSKDKFTGIFGIVLDNQVEYIEEYKNGLLDGESAWFSRDGSIKLLSEFYSKGKLNGEQKSFYDNGDIKSIVRYSNDRVNGITYYDKNGKIKFNSIFKNGSGDWKFFWSNGKVYEEGKYTNWRKDGVWKKYHEDGSLDSTITYNKGRILKERWE